jgi:hypothetical protein
VIEAQKWLENHYPEEVNTLLFNGGAKVKLTKDKDIANL